MFGVTSGHANFAVVYVHVCTHTVYFVYMNVLCATYMTS